MPGRRSSRSSVSGLLPLLGLFFLGDFAAAQALPLKREFGSTEPCTGIEVVNSGLVRSPEATDSLLAAGSRAAILGDNAAAANLLREAAASDPFSPVITYRLARALDEQGARREAITEYCRYLSVAGDALDRLEVDERVRELASQEGNEFTEPWELAGIAGVESYDRHEYQAAVTQFGRLIALRPHLPIGYYNRAVVYRVLENDEAALADLERYVALLPVTEVDTAALLVLESLRSSVPQAVTSEPAQPVVSGAAPGGVLIGGLLVPGLGQMVTDRAPLGMVVLAATAGAAFYGTRTRLATRLETAVDPFGNSYEYEVEYLERPYQLLGFAAAAGITVVAAIESFLFAERSRRTVRRVSTSPASVQLRVIPSPAKLTAEFRFSPPRR